VKTAVIVGQNHPDETSDGIVALHSRTIIFEPLPEAAIECRDRYANQPGVIVIQAACGEQFDQAELRVYNENGLSSSLGTMTQSAVDLYRNADLSEQRTEIVQVVHLGYMLDMMGIASIDFLMIDAQGMDFTILKTIEPLVSSHRIGYLQLEADGKGFKHYNGLPDNSEQAIVDWMARYPRYSVGKLPNRIDEQPDLVFLLDMQAT
jgi:FkbM family methyltransferase